nr:hypothetical protein [Tanacetum cinerariifolium]
MKNDEEDHALVAKAPIEFALMANTSTENKVFDNSLCLKDCKKNNDSLNSKITYLIDKLFDVKNMIYHYKLALAQVESRLVEYKEREVKYIKKIRTLEFYDKGKVEYIETLKKELETLKQEKEMVDGKLAGLLSVSKDIDNLIESQRPFQRKSTVRSQHRASWVPTVNRNFPPVNRKFSTGDRNFPTVNKKFYTASRKYPTGSTKGPTTDMGMKGKAVKSSACWSWKPLQNLSNKGPKNNSVSVMFKKYTYIDTQGRLKSETYPFGQGGCKITGKGTIKTGKLEFENVYFVKDLKYNLFSVSQICDNKNSVLFTDSECIVLGRDFKLLDDANILLRTPRKHNMYSIDLNNIVPHKDLTCLVAKASADECNLWHRRLGNEGYFLRYSMSSKAFRIFNKRTKRVEENVHIEFLENKAIEKGSGLNWLFDIDSLTKSINYVPVVDAGTHSTNFSGTKVNASKDVKKYVSSLRYIVLPNWGHEEHLESTSSQPQDTRNTDASENSGNSNPTATSTNPPVDQLETLTVETPIPTVSSPVLTVCFTDSQEPSSETRLISKRVTNQEETPSLDNIPMLTNQFEDILGVTSNSKESNEVEADVSYMETSITASPILTLRIHRDHPKKPKKISNTLQDPSWVEAMQEELLQIKIQKVWSLVDCLKGVRPIGTKWVLKNKKDERGIVIKNKSRLVAQGHTQEEGIDYDEVFAPVARIEAIRLFLAYASFMGFIVYQMDAKSAFLYDTIDEEVYVMQPPGFQDPKYPSRVYKAEKAIEFEALMHEKFQMSDMGELNFFLGLQVLQKEDGIFLSQDKYVGDILKKFGYSDVRSSNTPMDKENPWGKDGTKKDVDLHLYRSMIGSLMYLTASRPDIMFAVCACARHQVTPKECHLHAVKRIFRYLKGHPKLGLWYPKDSSFDLVAYSDSDYGGATQDRKSTSGGCQFLGRRLISWQCKK